MVMEQGLNQSCQHCCSAGTSSGGCEIRDFRGGSAQREAGGWLVQQHVPGLLVGAFGVCCVQEWVGSEDWEKGSKAALLWGTHPIPSGKANLAKTSPA